MARCCVRTTEGLSHPFKVEAARGQRHLRRLRWPSQACQPALLGEAPLGCGHHSGRPHPFVRPSTPLPRSRGDAEPPIGSARRLLFVRRSLETVSYGRSCPVYCPCRLSHRPGPRARGPLWRCWLSLKDRALEPADEAAASLLPRLQLCCGFPILLNALRQSGLRVSQTPGSRVPDRQSWLRASACLCAAMTCYQVNVALMTAAVLPPGGEGRSGGGGRGASLKGYAEPPGF